MTPIFEQSDGRGIGYGLESFLQRFQEICLKHLNENRASSFAFILYDFQNNELRHLLKDQGVFTQLDRLSGKDLSIFYLHTGSRNSIEKFNTMFLSVLGVEELVQLPCVVFFRYSNEEILNVSVAQLDSSNLIHGFHELYDVIERYIKVTPDETQSLRYLKWLKAGSKFVSIEAFRTLLRIVLGSLL